MDECARCAATKHIRTSMNNRKPSDMDFAELSLYLSKLSYKNSKLSKLDKDVLTQAAFWLQYEYEKEYYD